jgi:molybdenum cofactor synthesis domain-containing protein
MRAAILAIGTEITSGQIINRNAAWLAERLEELGVEAPFHLAVPDERGLMRDALELAHARAEWIFVTGGLGPTTDDFTRDVIADWAGLPLEFHEPSWLKIQNRLSRAGIAVAESNRQQCFFPRGSTIYSNAQGTADAFGLTHPAGQGKLWALPGPPREVLAVWESGGIRAEVQALAPARKRLELLTWQTLGRSEAEVGEVAERAVQGAGLLMGYRAHRPYVEVKVWAPPLSERSPAQGAALQALENAIGAWTVTRNGEELVHLFWKRAQEVGALDWQVDDRATRGLLLERLGLGLRTLGLNPNLEAWTSGALPPPHQNPSAWRLHLTADFEHQNWQVSLVRKDGTEVLREGFPSPYRIPPEPDLRPAFVDRVFRFAAERALWAALRAL